MEYEQAYRAAEHYFGTEPASLLINHYHRIEKSGRVLDLGTGQGRHALFLARKGYPVDAIDPSRAAIDRVSSVAEQEGLPIQIYRCGFEAFAPQTEGYSAILIFGLIQILAWESIELLLGRMRSWTRSGSVIFARAFTTADASFERTRRSRKWKSAGRNSFTDGHGHFRTFLETGEILDLFGSYKVLHHWEGLGPEHRHADGPAERHAEAEGVFQR